MKQTSLCTLLLAAVLCCFQVGLLSACGGCSARHAEQTAEKSSADSGRTQDLRGVTVQARESQLTEEAEITAAYLTLMQALSQGDEDAALQAAEILAQGKGDLALPPEYWLECSLWFIDHKSVNAIPFLRTACRAQPDVPSLTLLYCEALTEHNFAKEALATLDAYLARHPGDTDILLQKGITLHKDGRPNEALQVFDAIKGEDRTSFLDFYHAQALMAVGREKEALTLVRQAVRRMPDYGEALALQAFLCEKLDNLREARQAYEKLLEQRYARKDILLRLIVISLKLNQPSKALTYYQQGPADDITFQLSVASLFTDFRHYLQAERILKNVSARPDAPAEVYLFLANLTYEQRRDLNAALAWLDKIADDGDVAQRKLLLKSQLQAEDGKKEEALATARAGREKSPSVPDFVLLEARILASSDRLDEALTVIREGVKQWPDSMEIAFLLGSLLSETGQAQEAFTVMESIIARDDSNVRALNYVGYTLANENRDLDRALRLLNKANALAPGKSFILDSLAWAYYRLGNYAMAWDLIREAVRLDSQPDPEIWDHYGDIAVGKGLRDEARNAYRKAIEEGEGKLDTEVLRKKLEAL